MQKSSDKYDKDKVENAGCSSTPTEQASTEGCDISISVGCLHTEDCDAKAIGKCSHAEGCKTRAIGKCSHAEGCFSIAVNKCSHAEGDSTIAGTDTEGKGAHAEGCSTQALADCSHAEGNQTTASGFVAHTEGIKTIARGEASHAEGGELNGGVVTASGSASHAEGLNTTASNLASHAEGTSTIANGDSAHAEGTSTTASGGVAHAEGFKTTASGSDSHAEGFETMASEFATHAEGIRTIASSKYAHSEGELTTASGEISHAEGFGTTARGDAAHAEGFETVASSKFAHAEGELTTASGFASHAEGDTTTASGDVSHAEGLETSTNGHPGGHIMGKYGDASADFSWFLANGTSETNRSIAAKILNNGDACFTGKVTIGGGPGSCADYAEMFETLDGSPIDCGYFVTLDGEKIRKANENDDFILGIISATPAVIANSGDLNWKDKYITDEWGRIIYQDVIVPAVTAKDGNVIFPERTESQPVLNSTWDNTREFIPRCKRPEWVAVGLMGKILVRDDGTCQMNGYCKPNHEGIATASRDGYRVMKRIGKNQVLVFFNHMRLGHLENREHGHMSND